MKIIEGIKYEGSPSVIPESTRDDLPGFFKEMGYKVGAEIGVYKGWFSRKLCKAGLKVYAIDCWTPYPGFDRMEDARIERQEYLYHRAWQLLSHYQNAVVIRKTSMEALKNFEDESLDFVYIDANHILKYALEDIDGWSKKVRKGGAVSGHDYIHPDDLEERKRPWAWATMQVKFAVDAYTQANRIKGWYLIGQNKDRYPSWLWIK
jgi:hypothetical protein